MQDSWYATSKVVMTHPLVENQLLWTLEPHIWPCSASMVSLSFWLGIWAFVSHWPLSPKSFLFWVAWEPHGLSCLESPVPCKVPSLVIQLKPQHFCKLTNYHRRGSRKQWNGEQICVCQWYQCSKYLLKVHPWRAGPSHIEVTGGLGKESGPTDILHSFQKPVPWALGVPTFINASVYFTQRQHMS